MPIVGNLISWNTESGVISIGDEKNVYVFVIDEYTVNLIGDAKVGEIIMIIASNWKPDWASVVMKNEPPSEINEEEKCRRKEMYKKMKERIQYLKENATH